MDMKLLADVERAAYRRMAKPSVAWTDDDIGEIAAFNAEVGNASGAAIVRDFADSDTLCVMTGQQAGALGGPLYTLYKALGAVALAEAMQERLGRRVVAGFWVASDDHDFDEIRPVVYQDQSDQPQRLLLDVGVETGAISAHTIPLGDSVDAILTSIEGTTRGGAFRDAALEAIRAASSSSSTLEDFFCRCLARLLGSACDLFLVTPRMTALRRAQPAVLDREFREPGRSTDLLLAAGESYHRDGQKPPLHRRPGDVNCFLYEGDVRAHLTWRDGRFVAAHPTSHEEIASYSVDETLALLVSNPERFSPNVATRPLTQDVRFPTIAYVAGPGEQAYFEQVAPLYDYFGVVMPAIVRRPGGLLVEAKVSRALEKLGVSVAEFLKLGGEGVMTQRAMGQDDGPLSRITTAREAIVSALDSLDDGLNGADPGVQKGAKKLRGSVEGGLEKLKERVAHAVSQEDRVARDRCVRLGQSLRPGGNPQERVYGAFFPFYAHYGERLAPFLKECFLEDFAPDQIIDLGAIHE